MKTKLFLAIGMIATCSLKAQLITTFCGNGTGTYSGDGGQATGAAISSPLDVKADAAGNLYIADYSHHRIRKVNTAGIITTIAGNGTAGFSGDGGQATAAKINSPTGVTVDATGNLYIADDGNNRIRKVSTAGIITTIAGNGTAGFSGDGGQATAAGLNAPWDVAIDNAGNLYIPDLFNNCVRIINTAGIISTVAGSHTLGPGFSGDGGQATDASLLQPSNVTFDNTGNLYIADDGNNRIRMVTTAGIITTVVGTNLPGGYSGDEGPATAAQINDPGGIACDNAGNLYIADVGNNLIRKVNNLGIITTVAGNITGAGTGSNSGYSGDGGQATAANLASPTGVTFDATGNLYIADSYNNRIRTVSNVGQAAGIVQFTNNNEQVTIYPNPNNGSFVVEPNSSTKQTMQVYDVNGKLVLTQTINGKTTIDAGSLNEGIYNISITGNEGIANKRLVIAR
jgi:sugar lactone lactonase YvrE